MYVWAFFFHPHICTCLIREQRKRADNPFKKKTCGAIMSIFILLNKYIVCRLKIFCYEKKKQGKFTYGGEKQTYHVLMKGYESQSGWK
jgi:hypothetical protein